MYFFLSIKCVFVYAGKGKISPNIIIAIAISIAVSVLLFVIGCCYMVKKSKKNYGDATDQTGNK